MSEFKTFEYKEIIAEEPEASFLRDGYENFGWEITEKPDSEHTPNGHRRTILHMKRDRKIINRPELTRLQQNFETCIREIGRLDAKKSRKATTVSLSTGIIGCAFLSVSVMAFTAPHPIYWLHILTAVLGIIGWILPYFFYNKIKAQSEEELNPLIEQKYDEIYEICEKGHRLLIG